MTVNISDCVEYVGRNVFAGRAMSSIFGGIFMTSALITVLVLMLVVFFWGEDAKSKLSTGIYAFLVVLFGVYAHGNVVRYSSVDRSNDEKSHSIITSAVANSAQEQESYAMKTGGSGGSNEVEDLPDVRDHPAVSRPSPEDILFDISTVENPYESLV
jgi:hypothetical protein